MKKATFVKTILVDDPDENVLTTVSLSIYKHENGMMFAVDSQYLNKWHEAAYPVIPDPFGDKDKPQNEVLMLTHG